MHVVHALRARSEVRGVGSQPRAIRGRLLIARVSRIARATYGGELRRPDFGGGSGGGGGRLRQLRRWSWRRNAPAAEAAAEEVEEGGDGGGDGGRRGGGGREDERGRARSVMRRPHSLSRGIDPPIRPWLTLGVLSLVLRNFLVRDACPK